MKGKIAKLVPDKVDESVSKTFEVVSEDIDEITDVYILARLRGTGEIRCYRNIKRNRMAEFVGMMTWGIHGFCERMGHEPEDRDEKES